LSFGTYLYTYWIITMELKGYFQKLPNNKPILNKLTENNLLDLVRKRELSPEQGTSFLYNILKIR
jgi:hypothetical protein